MDSLSQVRVSTYPRQKYIFPQKFPNAKKYLGRERTESQLMLLSKFGFY